MREIISPNVTLIAALDIPLPNEVEWARIHKRGIIEIQTTPDPDLLDAVKDCFEYYDREGELYPVSVTGLKTVMESEKTGSVRFCGWDGTFAEDLTEIIKVVEAPELVDAGDFLYEFQEVSKYFRFMRYSKGGQHFPHYDSDFVVKNGMTEPYATKYSLVMYFNDCDTGEIAFIDTDEKTRTDWERQAYDSEIFLKIKPQAGKIVLFPHDVCHTVLPFTDDGERYIVRGDLIFTRYGK